MLDIPILLAFTAGLISFLAPCVLPLIPGYLAFLSGTSLSDASSHRLQIFITSLFFVLGFATVFATIGVLLNTLLEAVAFDAQIWLARIGGALVIFFGLYLTGLIKLGFLQREYRVQVNPLLHSRNLSSFLFGAAFAAGWTPCVGAVLGSILGLATTQPGSAFFLLLSYSIGFGIPFLIVGLFAASISSFLTKLAEVAKYINIAFGGLLVVFGILIFTNNLQKIANFELLLNLYSSN